MEHRNVVRGRDQQTVLGIGHHDLNIAAVSAEGDVRAPKASLFVVPRSVVKVDAGDSRPDHVLPADCARTNVPDGYVSIHPDVAAEHRNTLEADPLTDTWTVPGQGEDRAGIGHELESVVHGIEPPVEPRRFVPLRLGVNEARPAVDQLGMQFVASVVEGVVANLPNALTDQT
jgi:hypothetical protein